MNDPLNPKNVNSINNNNAFTYRIITIEIREKMYAILADGAAGLKIIEVSNPLNPLLVSSINTGGRAMDVSMVEIRGKIYVLLADRENGLKIIEVNYPYNP